MVKYKKTISGEPYVRNVDYTKGFVQGVGYTKNLLANKPAWVATTALCAVSAAIAGYNVYLERNMDLDDRLATRESYTVRRREDVKDPTRDCYN